MRLRRRAERHTVGGSGHRHGFGTDSKGEDLASNDPSDRAEGEEGNSQPHANFAEISKRSSTDPQVEAKKAM